MGFRTLEDNVLVGCGQSRVYYRAAEHTTVGFGFKNGKWARWILTKKMNLVDHALKVALVLDQPKIAWDTVQRCSHATLPVLSSTENQSMQRKLDQEPQPMFLYGYLALVANVFPVHFGRRNILSIQLNPNSCGSFLLSFRFKGRQLVFVFYYHIEMKPKNVLLHQRNAFFYGLTLIQAATFWLACEIEEPPEPEPYEPEPWQPWTGSSTCIKFYFNGIARDSITGQPLVGVPLRVDYTASCGCGSSDTTDSNGYFELSTGNSLYKGETTCSGVQHGTPVDLLDTAWSVQDSTLIPSGTLLSGDTVWIDLHFNP